MRELYSFNIQKCGFSCDFSPFYSISPTTLERIRFRSPVEVGKETVYALRRGVGYVAVPRYCLPIGKLVQ